MKITYLHQYFKTPQMPGGTRSYEFARRLAAAGHEVQMITSDCEHHGKPYRSDESGFAVTWIPCPYSNKLGAAGRVRAFLTFAARSMLVAARTDADVIFATSTPLTIALPAIVAKWWRRVPFVLEVRDPWPEMLIGLGALHNPVLKFLTRQLELFAYRNAAEIIALSDGMRETILATGYPQERITVIPNASDLERFTVSATASHAFRHRFAWLQDRKLVLYAGAIGIANGVDYLVDVAREMIRLDPEVRFLVIGTGGQEDAVRARARNAGVLDRTFFLMPPVPKAEIPIVFSACDISLVLLKDVPELWTNSSNKFFDGLAAGRPVVVNDVGWQATLLAESGAGFDIPPHDHATAARMLHEHLSDDEWLGAAGANARRLAMRRFHRDDLARRFEHVLVRAAHRERSGSCDLIPSAS